MEYVLGLPIIESSRLKDSQPLPSLEESLIGIGFFGGSLLVALYIVGMGAWWTPHELFGLFDQDWAVLSILLAFIVVTLLHEATHLFAFPGFGLRFGVVGYYHQGGAPYVAYTRPVSRNRYVFVLIAPMVVLTGIFLAAGIQFPSWRNELLFCATVNVFGSGFDLLSAITLVAKVPSNQWIQGRRFGSLIP